MDASHARLIVNDPYFFSNNSLSASVVHPWKDKRIAANGQKVQDNFQAWFGASRVVDGFGRPQVLYHGTRTQFSAFGVGDIGYHFGTRDAACKRLQDLHEKTGCGWDGAHVMPVYLSLQNPLRLLDAGDWFDEERISSVMIDVCFDEEFGERYLQALDELDAKHPGVNHSYRQIFEHLGHDGIVYHNAQEGGGDSFIAFRPSQIKSALGNSGLYSRLSDELDDQTLARAHHAAAAAWASQPARHPELTIPGR